MSEVSAHLCAQLDLTAYPAPCIISVGIYSSGPAGLEYRWPGLSDQKDIRSVKTLCLRTLVEKCLEHLATLYQIKPPQAKKPAYIAAKDI